LSSSLWGGTISSASDGRRGECEWCGWSSRVECIGYHSLSEVWKKAAPSRTSQPIRTTLHAVYHSSRSDASTRGVQANKDGDAFNAVSMLRCWSRTLSTELRILALLYSTRVMLVECGCRVPPSRCQTTTRMMTSRSHSTAGRRCRAQLSDGPTAPQTVLLTACFPYRAHDRDELPDQ
jgi:hypothetical protein